MLITQLRSAHASAHLGAFGLDWSLVLDFIGGFLCGFDAINSEVIHKNTATKRMSITEIHLFIMWQQVHGTRKTNTRIAHTHTNCIQFASARPPVSV